ncbi:MAG: hypothetical protein HRT53_20715 [Colwellia sp.]|nr:hypothetical protein [Colwellia sp.]
MTHNFIAIPVAWIPTSTKTKVPSYRDGFFSNDKCHLLLDDAHPRKTFQEWFQWECFGSSLSINDTELLIDHIIQYSPRFTKPEIKVEFLDVNSIWYRG